MPVDEYLGALARELTLRLPTADEPLATLYLGGGTPSRLGGEGIARLVALVRERRALESRAEITLEANPEDVASLDAERWRAAGVDRLSLGVQSFDDDVLAWMHRTHRGDAASRAVTAAREAGIADISLDLIFALPDSLDRDWAGDLERAIALEPTHVSLYGLTVEPHTPLGRWTARGTVAEAPEERYEAELLLAHDRLTAAGFEHYEVSNYAKPGHRARHNSSYWSRVPYLGVGPSAHSFDGERRRWNLAAYTEWAAALAEGRDPRAGEEVLTSEDRATERVYLGLRTSAGLAVTPAEAERAAPWIAAGWATLEAETLRLTPAGWLRLDALAADLTMVGSLS